MSSIRAKIDIATDSNESIALFDESLDRLRNVPEQNLLFCIFSSENGIERFLKNPSFLSVKQVSALVELIAKTCSNQTFPESSKRLLKDVTLVNFVTDQIDHYIVKQFAELTNDDLEKFSFNAFTILFHIFRLDEIHNYERLCSIVKTIELKLSQKEFSFDHVVMSKFNEVIKNINQKEKPVEIFLNVSPKESTGHPDNFREIPTFPTAADLSGSDKDYLPKNKSIDQTKNVDEYLDMQFRLMREDFIAILRDGISEFSHSSGNIIKLRNLYVYQNTRICFPICTDNDIAYIVTFDVDNLSHIIWKNSSRLKCGRLVILSDDRFLTFLIGTVISTNSEELSKGFVAVNFQNNVSLDSRNYVMLETMFFHSNCRSVLEKFQRFETSSFPMQEYIIGSKRDISRNNKISFDLSSLLNNEGRKNDAKISYSIYDFKQWPDVKDLVVDQRQYDAIQNALTKELTLIQGPPGTGKTFIGLKIVEILLNSDADCGPILIVSHTNHALSKFLEGVYSFCETDIVTVGNLETSHITNLFNIDFLRKTSLQEKSLQVPFQDEIQRRIKTVTKESNNIADMLRIARAKQLTSRTCILTLAHLDRFISRKQSAELSSFKDDDILKVWLLDFCPIVDQLLRNDLHESKVETNEQDDELPTWWMSTQFEEEENVGKERIAFRIVYETLSERLFRLSEVCIGERNILSNDLMTKEEAESIDNPWNLSQKDRWRLYRCWIHEYTEAEERLAFPLVDRYNHLLKEKEELRYFQDCEIMRNAKVIGMTTSGASRYSRVLDSIQPKIVIVEEAAEILEGNLVASLSSGCQQLILIGDHEQLKPTTSAYHLTKQFCLDVSLFERLINNNLNYTMLNVQRRMHPDIANLIKFIYPKVQSDLSVLNYCDVRGLKERLTFINHNNPEEQLEKEKGYKNDFEADYCLALCRHLLLNGYDPSRITLLTMYNGQLRYIQSLMRKSNQVFQGVLVCSVDNFQSECNDIIILSLVRSNTNDTIGFIGEKNRISVALSRAKHGLFVVGNFDLLSTNSELWREIVNDLRNTDYYSDGVSLKCQLHPKKPVVKATKPDHFNSFAAQGGCTESCSARLGCGHRCENICHPNDHLHEKYTCQKLVTHRCPNCNTIHKMQCHEDKSKFKCTSPCVKVFDCCGHLCTKLCKQECSINCEKLVLKRMPFCNHLIEVPCFQRPLDFVCTEPCDKQLDCHHSCAGTCGTCSAGRLHIRCEHKNIEQSFIRYRNKKFADKITATDFNSISGFLEKFDCKYDSKQGDTLVVQNCLCLIEELQSFITYFDAKFDFEKTSGADEIRHTWHSFRNLLLWLNPSHRCFNVHEIKQFDNEFQRINDLCEFLTGWKSASSEEGMNKWMTRGVLPLLKTVVYSETEQKEMQTVLNELRRQPKDPLIFQTDVARSETVDTIGFCKGYWNLCPNDSIDEQSSSLQTNESKKGFTSLQVTSSLDPLNILLEKTLNKLKDIPHHQLSFCLMDSENGIERFLKDPSFLSVKQVAALVELITNACSDQTFPESSKRLLKDVTLVNFVTGQIDHYIVEQFAELTKKLNDEDLEKFICTSFRILRCIFNQNKSCYSDEVCTVVKAINLKLRQNQISISSSILSKFTDVLEIGKNVTEVRAYNQGSITNRDNFREMSIFPTTDDIFTVKSDEVFLHKNKSVNHYESIDDYLEMQFRLVREDFVAPLRDNILEFRKYSDVDCKDLRLKKLHVYPNTQICYSICTYDDIAYVVRFDLDGLSHVTWEKTERFKPGRLVILSADNFQTFIFGTVVFTRVLHLKSGFVNVKLYGNCSVHNRKYTMLETMQYVNASEHVLERLQHIEVGSFLMKKYMICSQRDIDRPVYQLNTAITFDLSPLQKKGSGKLNYTIGDCKPWPDVGDLVVDQSQYDSIQNALTKELSIIQGLPGTGKTFVGVKIVNILLNSLSDIGPIIVIARTNHALDHFLEGVYSFCKRDIVRIGNQGKSSIANGFKISFLKSSVHFQSLLDPFKQNIRLRYEIITQELKEIEEKLSIHRSKQLTARTCIHTLKSLHTFISKDHLNKLSATKHSDDVLMKWLLDSSVVNEEDFVSGDRVELLDNLQTSFNEFSEVNDFPNWWFLTEFQEGSSFGSQYSKHSENLYRLNDCSLNGIDNCGIAGCIQVGRNSLGTELLSKDRMTREEAEQIDDPWVLRLKDRWRLYRTWIHDFTDQQELLAIPLDEKYNDLLMEKRELRYFEDCVILLNAKVIFMTTSGASRYCRIFDSIKPKIVIVEEAAEASESHLVTSLSSGCQHLILIGNNEQLKPTTSLNSLAQKIDINISLFERLINNTFEFTRFNLQRRMHPDISQLLKFIYPALQDDPSLSNYPDIRGLKERLAFLNHNQPEQEIEEIKCFKNEFEGKYSLALCHHLLKNGYSQSQITLLTLYKGQLGYIKSLCANSVCKTVPAYTVDNFQSVENDIIILSLVRSNSNDIIGFIEQENKICIALSRAKHGLFVVGNFDLLSTNCKFKFINHLRNTSILSDGISLKCKMHPLSAVGIASNADDFCLYAPEGGCKELCDALLKCGHQCEKFCHPIDQKHENSTCKKMVKKQCPDCKNEQEMFCHVDPEHFSCRTPCPKILNCGHPCTKLCKQPCSILCEKLVFKSMPFCKHEIEVPCYLHPWDFDCTEPCGKQLGCEHSCSGTCGSCSAGRLHIQCVQKCERPLVCGHYCVEGCFMNCPPCKENCIDECPHSRCDKRCGDRCVPCREQCGWRCKHQQCTKLCSDFCDRDFCNEPCKERFLCPQCKSNQDCVGLCGEQCPKKCQNCDPELKTIFLGYEDDPHARYITLWTCGHTLEVTGLDEWMNIKDEATQPKSCPTCKTQITRKSCWRYSNIVKSLNTNIQDAKENKIQQYEKEKRKIQTDVFDHKLIETFLVQFNCKQDLKSGSKNSLQNCLSVLDKLRKLYSQYEGKLDLIKSSKSVEIQHTWYSIRNLLRWLNPCKRNFNRHEIKQCEEEFQRIGHLCEFLVGWKFAKPKEVRDEWMNRGVRSLVEKYSYSEEQQTDMNQLLIELRGRSSELPSIPLHERLEIVMAVDKGDWYICPNGHPYYVGEDGAPKQLSTCPECLVAIGAPGDTGQLAPLNTRFPQMYNKLSPKNPGD